MPASTTVPFYRRESPHLHTHVIYDRWRRQCCIYTPPARAIDGRRGGYHHVTHLPHCCNLCYHLSRIPMAEREIFPASHQKKALSSWHKSNESMRADHNCAKIRARAAACRQHNNRTPPPPPADTAAPSHHALRVAFLNTRHLLPAMPTRLYNASYRIRVFNSPACAVMPLQPIPPPRNSPTTTAVACLSATTSSRSHDSHILPMPRLPRNIASA